MLITCMTIWTCELHVRVRPPLAAGRTWEAVHSFASLTAGGHRPSQAMGYGRFPIWWGWKLGVQGGGAAGKMPRHANDLFTARPKPTVDQLVTMTKKDWLKQENQRIRMMNKEEMGIRLASAHLLVQAGPYSYSLRVARIAAAYHIASHGMVAEPLGAEPLPQPRVHAGERLFAQLSGERNPLVLSLPLPLLRQYYLAAAQRIVTKSLPAARPTYSSGEGLSIQMGPLPVVGGRGGCGPAAVQCHSAERICPFQRHAGGRASSSAS